MVRRWLEVFPEEMDLRLRLLALLEETDRLPEARRLARELRADPLADLRVRSAVGEFWLRQEDPAEARRVFSEIVRLIYRFMGKMHTNTITHAYTYKYTIQHTHTQYNI